LPPKVATNVATFVGRSRAILGDISTFYQSNFDRFQAVFSLYGKSPKTLKMLGFR
jgi:hypothetical protein